MHAMHFIIFVFDTGKVDEKVPQVFMPGDLLVVVGIEGVQKAERCYVFMRRAL